MVKTEVTLSKHFTQSVKKMFMWTTLWITFHCFHTKCIQWLPFLLNTKLLKHIQNRIVANSVHFCRNIMNIFENFIWIFPIKWNNYHSKHSGLKFQLKAYLGILFFQMHFCFSFLSFLFFFTSKLLDAKIEKGKHIEANYCKFLIHYGYINLSPFIVKMSHSYFIIKYGFMWKII